jgi:hypothetical protein
MGPQPNQLRHPGAQLAIGTGAVGHRHVVFGHEGHFRLVQPDTVRRQDPPVEHAQVGQVRRCAPAVAVHHHPAFRLGLGQVDLDQGVPLLGRLGHGHQSFGGRL